VSHSGSPKPKMAVWEPPPLLQVYVKPLCFAHCLVPMSHSVNTCLNKESKQMSEWISEWVWNWTLPRFCLSGANLQKRLIEIIKLERATYKVILQMSPFISSPGSKSSAVALSTQIRQSNCVNTVTPLSFLKGAPREAASLHSELKPKSNCSSSH
jgi:hypothetical protein